MPKYAVDLNEPRLARCSEVFRLDAKEINKFYDVYKKLDKTRAEVIPSDVFFAGFHHKEGTQIGDALLELIDVDNSDQLTFPEFVQLVCTFAFFEEAEVLRLCFFVLDATKRGHCRPDELEYFLLKLWDDDDSRLAEHIDFFMPMGYDMNGVSAAAPLASSFAKPEAAAAQMGTIVRNIGGCFKQKEVTPGWARPLACDLFCPFLRPSLSG